MLIFKLLLTYILTIKESKDGYRKPSKNISKVYKPKNWQRNTITSVN